MPLGRLNRHLFTFKKKIFDSWNEWNICNLSCRSASVGVTTQASTELLLAESGRGVMIQSPGFLRHEVRDKLVVSTCVMCHRTVASSDSRLLRVAETAHMCPKLEHSRSPQPRT